MNLIEKIGAWIEGFGHWYRLRREYESTRNKPRYSKQELSLLQTREKELRREILDILRDNFGFENNSGKCYVSYALSTYPKPSDYEEEGMDRYFGRKYGTIFPEKRPDNLLDYIETIIFQIMEKEAPGYYQKFEVKKK